MVAAAILTYQYYFKIKPQLEFAEYLLKLKDILNSKQGQETLFISQMQDQTHHNTQMLRITKDIMDTMLRSCEGEIGYLKYQAERREIALKYGLKMLQETWIARSLKGVALPKYKIYEENSPLIIEWDSAISRLKSIFKDFNDLSIRLEESLCKIDQLGLGRCSPFHFITNKASLRANKISEKAMQEWENSVLPLELEKGDVMADSILDCKVISLIDKELKKIDQCIDNLIDELGDFQVEEAKEELSEALSNSEQKGHNTRVFEFNEFH